MSFLPYWWTRVRRSPEATFQYSSYVIARYALTKSVLDAGRITAPEPNDFPSAEKALEWLYHLLSVLDGKASALMRLNGVMLAAAAFLLNPQFHSGMLVKFLVAVSAIGSSISIACCLMVVSVDWPFLGLVTKVGKNLDFSDEFFHLQEVADFRQVRYRSGWYISFATTIAFLIAIIAFFA